MVAEFIKKWNTPALRKYVLDHNKIIRFHIGKEIKEARVAYSKFLKVKRRDLKAAQEIDIKGMKKNQIIEAILKEPVLMKRIKDDIDNKRAPAGFHYMEGGVIMKGDKHGGAKKEEGGAAEKKKIKLVTFYDDEPKKSNLKTVTKEDIKELGKGKKKRRIVVKDSKSLPEIPKPKGKTKDPNAPEPPKRKVKKAKILPETPKPKEKKKKELPKPKPKPALDPEKKRRIQRKVKDLGRRAIDKKRRQGESIGKAAFKMKNEKSDLYKYVKNNLDPTKSEEKQPKLIQELIDVYLNESQNTGDRFGEHGIYKDRTKALELQNNPSGKAVLKGDYDTLGDEFFAGYDDKTDEYGPDTKNNKLRHRKYIKKRMLEEIRDGMMDLEDVTESGFTEEDLKEKAPAPKKKIQIKKPAPKPAPKKEEPAPKKEESKKKLKLIKEIPTKLKAKWFRYMDGVMEGDPYDEEDQEEEYRRFKENNDEYFEAQKTRKDKSLTSREQFQGVSKIQEITEEMKEIINEDEDNNKKLIKSLFPKFFDALYK